MQFNKTVSSAVVALGLVGCATATQQGTTIGTPSTGSTPILSASNPFYAASTLQYQAPPFNRIKDSDYEPAIVAGMQQQIAEIDAIANQAAAPNFDNTIVAMERSGVLLKHLKGTALEQARLYYQAFGRFGPPDEELWAKMAHI